MVAIPVYDVSGNQVREVEVELKLLIRPFALRC